MRAHGGSDLDHLQTPDELCVQFLSSVGDGTGTTEMKSAGHYKLLVPASRVLEAVRLSLLIQDGATTFRPERYGEIDNSGGSGCILTIRDSAGAVLKTLTPTAVKSVAQWANYCGGIVDLTTFGSGDDAVVVNWIFDGPLTLYPGQSINFQVQDDLSGLVSHLAVVHGRWRTYG